MTMRLIGSYIAKDVVEITPSPDALESPVYGLKVTTGGDITYTTKAGTTITETVLDGERIPVIITHVTAATASGLIGYLPYGPNNQ